ncbi:hypothetical protein UCRPC4_g05337 [Phaeomoniella chlamydospora]|uniref:Uncharacterized protein n=1 Tax=Phaeomoniella chlamydospora TaxID=158046 RepID=A0A0G2E4Q8_PHACM|nr:hypothetical protein UCRPC4_g05337 [Phaeomoniella chlamydospora]
MIFEAAPVYEAGVGAVRVGGVPVLPPLLVIELLELDRTALMNGPRFIELEEVIMDIALSLLVVIAIPPAVISIAIEVEAVTSSDEATIMLDDAAVAVATQAGFPSSLKVPTSMPTD